MRHRKRPRTPAPPFGTKLKTHPLPKKIRGRTEAICRAFDCEPLAEVRPLVPEEDWPKFYSKVELRTCVEQILNQRQVGSCASEAACQGLMVKRAYEGQEHVQLNPWTLYRQLTTTDRGSNIGRNLEALRKTGAIPMAFWDRSHRWNQEPPKGWQDVAQFHRIDEYAYVKTWQEEVSSLLMGNPVEYGRKGHAILAVTALEKYLMDVANSWAESWGDKGFFKESPKAANFDYGAWATLSTVSCKGWREPTEQWARNAGLTPQLHWAVSG